MITNKKVSLQILLKNDVELKYYEFRSTVKICDHSLYTQIVIKKIFTFFVLLYKNDNFIIKWIKANCKKEKH